MGLLARAVHAPQGRGDAPRGGRGARRGSGLGQCRATLEQQHEQQVDEPHRIKNATFVALREITRSAQLGSESCLSYYKSLWRLDFRCYAIKVTRCHQITRSKTGHQSGGSGSQVSFCLYNWDRLVINPNISQLCTHSRLENNER